MIVSLRVSVHVSLTLVGPSEGITQSRAGHLASRMWPLAKRGLECFPEHPQESTRRAMPPPHPTHPNQRIHSVFYSCSTPVLFLFYCRLPSLSFPRCRHCLRSLTWCMYVYVLTPKWAQMLPGREGQPEPHEDRGATADCVIVLQRYRTNSNRALSCSSSIHDNRELPKKAGHG